MAHNVVTSARLFRTREVAGMLSYDPATVLRKVRKGELRAIRFGPNSLRFALEDIEAFIAKRRGQ